MRIFHIFISIFLLLSCSFDNKSGIWQDNNEVPNKKQNSFKDFKKLSSSNNTFNKIVEINQNFEFNLTNPITNYGWNDELYNEGNNFDNFKYDDINTLIFKSKKLTKYQINNYILYNKNKLIFSDQNGNLIIFSVKENRIVNKFNFYKNQYKKIKKVLNLIVENNTIYVSDNLGFLYAFNYETNKILWAKNYKVPYRSNLKILQQKLIAATENNNLFFFDKTNGNILTFIPTEENVIQNKFLNNLSSNNKFTFFINSYGSLYAINNNNMKINWFQNLKETIDSNTSNLFAGSKIINYNNKLIISSNHSTYILDSNNGSILYKVNFSSIIKPIIVKNYLFIITKNNLLISFDLNKGDLIYSYNINDKVAEFLNIKKKNVNFKSLFMMNNNIFIFLKNSYLLKFNVNGNLLDVKKLPSKIKSDPIIIDKSILYLDKKNKLSIIN